MAGRGKAPLTKKAIIKKVREFPNHKCGSFGRAFKRAVGGN